MYVWLWLVLLGCGEPQERAHFLGRCVDDCVVYCSECAPECMEVCVARGGAAERCREQCRRRCDGCERFCRRKLACRRKPQR